MKIKAYTDRDDVDEFVNSVIYGFGSGVGSDQSGKPVTFGNYDPDRLNPVIVDLTSNRRRIEDRLRKDPSFLRAVLSLDALRETGIKLTRESLSDCLGIK